ncbi:calcium/sodium antiporter [Salinimicrobium sp. MT39]|uniref:Calcium/sodium antiporter n=1 Tax=Salinimicrobium profundisediminis TaxID=2994553 RepID=A0A9X3HZ43_9FLAO|nr:calcium/sodium antiporter [Salinimicrobium profundisediminis]MCX2836525.1 calcium/sodium antiporter [Salinimicrobium profundisediminis]
MILQFLLLIAGLLLLIKGADWLVENSSAFARKKNVSDLAVGLTIVAFGTSAPELVVNVVAAYQGHDDIVFGNVIGSNNFNLFFILGVAGLISPLLVQQTTVWKEIPISLLAAVVLYFLVNNFFLDTEGILGRGDAFILILFFLAFLYYVYTQLKDVPSTSPAAVKEISNTRIFGFIALGLAGLIIGGRLVVENAMDIASSLGVSEKIIGITIVAAGTSLPELATSVIAAFKKNNDIAVGNIVGSNIFNIFFILGLSALVKPIGYDIVFNTDLYLLFGGTILLFLFMFLGGKRKLERWEAGVLLLLYLAYTTYLVLNEL